MNILKRFAFEAVGVFITFDSKWQSEYIYICTALRSLFIEKKVTLLSTPMICE